jgi:diguanylate cyclase (GGDEF)-like protein
MPYFIESVADLTAHSDRGELEFTLASVTGSLLEAVRLVLWEVVNLDGQLRLRERLRLEGQRLTPAIGRDDLAELPFLATQADLRACYERGAPLALTPDETGLLRDAFPVMSSRGIVGLMEIYHPTPMRDDQYRLVNGLLTIYRNHLKILDYSEYDELTGLLNRKRFDDLLAQAMRAGAHRYEDEGAPDLWLAVLDVDFFKRINDRFGHLYGDEVLILLARLMRESFREKDRLFRFGGEEFVVLLADTPSETAYDVLERFRATVEAYAFPQVGRVTLSIGYTCVKEKDNGPAAFGRADEALYVAKRLGRNQVLRHEDLVSQGVIAAKSLVPAEVELF